MLEDQLEEEKEIKNTITFGEELVAPAIGFVLADENNTNKGNQLANQFRNLVLKK